MGANATFSQNRIENYTHRVVDYDTSGDVAGYYGYHTVEMGNHAALLLAQDHRRAVPGFSTTKGLEAVLHTQYVSKQYFHQLRESVI